MNFNIKLRKLTPLSFNSLLISIVLMLISNSCGVYSFTGVNIPPDIKTVSIQNFFNNAGNGPANLGNRFTESLRDYFQRNTNLTLVNTDGDLRIDGAITGYNTAPVAPTAASSGNPYPTTSSTRLTIAVQVNYVNTKDEEASFEQTFTQYSDFSESQALATVENEKIEDINNKLIFDIFNRALSNW